MAPAIHALVVPSAAMRPRPHKGWDPREPKLNCLTFNFPPKKPTAKTISFSAYTVFFLYVRVPQISDVWGKKFKAPGNQLHSFHFSLSRANEGRSREQLGEKPT